MIEYKIKGIQRFESKKGNRCCIIHVVYKDSRVDGLAAENLFIPEDQVTGGILEVGAVCNILFDRTGRVAGVIILPDRK